MSARDPRDAGGRASPAVTESVVSLVWGLAVLVALVLMLQGISAASQDPLTSGAVGEVRWGRFLVLAASCVMVSAGAYAVLVAGSPKRLAGALVAPVVLCAGLSLVASGTALPLLACLLAFPVALAAALDLLVPRPRRR